MHSGYVWRFTLCQVVQQPVAPIHSQWTSHRNCARQRWEWFCWQLCNSAIHQVTGLIASDFDLYYSGFSLNRKMRGQQPEHSWETILAASCLMNSAVFYSPNLVMLCWCTKQSSGRVLVAGSHSQPMNIFLFHRNSTIVPIEAVEQPRSQVTSGLVHSAITVLFTKSTAP